MSTSSIGSTLVERQRKAPPTDRHRGQIYVNSFDRGQRVAQDVRTIGIVRCAEKYGGMAALTLPEDNEQILAARYRTYLPAAEEPGDGES